MADSENSRTLPAISRGKERLVHGKCQDLPPIIDRRNLLSVAARLLSVMIAHTPQRRESGPTPVREMWPRWYEYHREHMRIIRLREKLQAQLLEEAGGLPVLMLPDVGKDGIVEVRSFADINRMATQLDAEHLSRARAELRRRRKQWKEADRRLGYSAIVAKEQELAERVLISGRVMWITRPSSLIEVTAKLHCLIVTHDPGLKLDEASWPELRTMLKDLLLLIEKGRPEPGNRPADFCKAADVRGILNLAARYRDAAITLGERLSKPNHLPRRLLALHSIELYLDALLLANGYDGETIRGIERDFNKRTRIATDIGLVLRKRTAAHLATLSSSREYLAVSYGPETTATLSQMNRVMATLDELSLKVQRMLQGLHGK
ncbi:hypothetical protein [Shinella oryzae]|uniref:hypothetical protein n=1 Tax=Shinella oryzae TaxID=2871820 RepID=UPI001FF5E063|nr:hypothetical protein [Shinella oryzae]